MARWHPWAIRLGELAVIVLVIAAAYAAVYSVTATPCPAHGSCDVAAPNHPHAELALWLAGAALVAFTATAAAAARWRML